MCFSSSFFSPESFHSFSFSFFPLPFFLFLHFLYVLVARSIISTQLWNCDFCVVRSFFSFSFSKFAKERKSLRALSPRGKKIFFFFLEKNIFSLFFFLGRKRQKKKEETLRVIVCCSDFRFSHPSHSFPSFSSTGEYSLKTAALCHFVLPLKESFFFLSFFLSFFPSFLLSLSFFLHSFLRGKTLKSNRVPSFP